MEQKLTRTPDVSREGTWSCVVANSDLVFTLADEAGQVIHHPWIANVLVFEKVSWTKQ